MAEVAAGAVTSLLGVIRSEARLLRLVRNDVQFIKEEMESMKSFLAHLARSAPPGGEHDEQVRTWMNQVRLLAQDCNNCIDLYLYRRNPDIHRANSGIWRYLWWVPWFMHKLVAQHRAAVRLRELKDRARDVGERRLRYGVEVPSKSAATAGHSPPSVARLLSAASSSAVAGGDAYAAGDDEEDGDDDQLAVSLFSRTLDDYVKTKILEWYEVIPPYAKETLSLAIVAPDRGPDIIVTFANESLVDKKHYYGCVVLIDTPALHPDLYYYSPVRPKDILYYILRQLKLKSKCKSQKQGTDQGEGEERLGFWQLHHQKQLIYDDKKIVLCKIKRRIENMKIYEKLDKIKKGLKTRPPAGQRRTDMDQIHVLLKQLLRACVPSSQQNQLMRNKDMADRLSASDDIINAVAEKLKEHMEADEQGREGGEGGDGRVENVVEEHPEGGKEKVEVTTGGGGEIEEEEPGGGGRGGEIVEEEEPGGGGRGGEIVEEESGGGGRGGEIEEEEEEEEPGGGGRGKEIVEEEPGGGATANDELAWFASSLADDDSYRDDNKQEDDDDDDNDDDDDDDDEEEEEEEEEEGEEEEMKIYLHIKQYIHILRQVFPKTSKSSNRSAMDQATDTTLGEDQIKQIIDESNQEIFLEPQGGKHDTMQDSAGQNKEDDIFTTIVDQTMDKISHEFKEQLKIKGLVDDIKHQLKQKCPLFILKLDETVYLPRWEDTRNALSLLACSADVLILTTAKDVQQAKEYCYPPKCEPIEYSLVGLYYDTVLEITKDQKEETYDPQIFRNILVLCEPHELLMKMFTHALFFNPKRSNEELNKLHKNLQASPKLFDIIAKKMFMFSYTDMPKEYKSCLLYLAIFPPGYKIRRSTLIGRWVAEGLIFKEDWASSVRRANRCFDELISRCLADPADSNGAAGKVKSCVVSDLVHGFITKIAKKQHIVETRLSRHLARHFSIFNDLQLRSSERIDGFFQRLSKSSSRVSLLKVLDLEGCQCFGGKNQRYLEDICSKMLLLKYLSLRGTDVTQLPSKINDLRELEVLDIRQTKVPPHATANVLLLKLKRLLAGNTDRTPRPTLRAEESVSTAVQIPHKIEKMVNMEVLSNVKARSSRDLKDIGKLWQLRKLGVVVDNDSSYLKNLLGAISDLHECLCSLSITLPTATSQELPLKLKHQPKLLESLSISGTTQKGFLPLFIKDVNNLVKVTLSSTSLNQNNLKDLARLPKLQLIRLRHIAFTNSKRELIFKQNEFISLKYLLVEGSTFTKVSFTNGAACMLEKMVLSFTNMESVSGVEGLQKLEEVELTMSMSSSNKNNDTLRSSFNNGKQIVKLTLVGTHEQADQSMIKFNKGEFQNLRLLTVDCSATKVVFTNGSAPKLEKIVWSSCTSLSLYGIDNLPILKEVEYNGDLVPKVVEEAIKNHKNKPHLKHNKPEIQDQAKADEQEDNDNDAARFSLFRWKKQV